MAEYHGVDESNAFVRAIPLGVSKDQNEEIIGLLDKSIGEVKEIIL